MIPTYAATTPSLGTADSFGILSSTFTRNIGVTAITGDLGYTTVSGSGSHTVTGTTFIPSPSQAGTDQGSALSALASQSCTFTFTGILHLASDTTHGSVGVYTPGVYCSTGAMDIEGGGTITLNGSGTYIFRSGGAFDTTAGSQVVLANSASACNVFWTPTAATTLGANTTFRGTVIDDAGITVGNTTSWTGRALAYSGTVTTDTDTITVPTCTSPTATPTPTSSPTATPTPTSSSVMAGSSTSTSSTSNGNASSCTATTINTVPIIISSKRISSTGVFISWGPNAGLSDFIVRYGFKNGNWQFSTKISGFSTVINDLPANQPIWVQVAATDNCAVGSFGASKLVGGIVSTSIPGFPNTGIGPHKSDISWSYVLVDILMRLLKLIGI